MQHLPYDLPSVRIGFACVLVYFLGLTGQSLESVQAEDKFEGALWRFEMKPVKGGENSRKGTFRVNGKKLYQKENPDDEELDKEVGHKEFVEKKKTRLVFEDLRANRGKVSGIKGTAVINYDRAGEWSGRMVDAEGAHWEFKCSRIQE